MFFAEFLNNGNTGFPTAIRPQKVMGYTFARVIVAPDESTCVALIPDVRKKCLEYPLLGILICRGLLFTVKFSDDTWRIKIQAFVFGQGTGIGIDVKIIEIQPQAFV